MVNGGKRAIEIAHRRWGKDEIALMVTRKLALERVGSYWHCMPEYEQGRKALWTAVNPHTGKRRIDEAFPAEIIEARDEQKMFIRLINGSTWQIIGSDQYDRTVGAGPAGIVYSEWALANPSAWAYHRPMVVENDGWAMFITTPRGENHAKAMLDMAQKSDHWFAEVSTVYDTEELTTDQLAEALQEYMSLYGADMGRAQYEQEYLCSFNAAILGAIWGKELRDAQDQGRITTVNLNPDLPIHTAWDFGKGENMAIWVFQVCNNQIRIIDFLRGFGIGIPSHVKELEKRGYRGGDDWVPHDARVPDLGSERTRLETMVGLGRAPRVVRAHHKVDGINAARVTLPICWFDAERCKDGLEALRQYRSEWDDKRKTFSDNTVHDWTSHPADALRYLAMAWREIEPPDTTPKTFSEKVAAEIEDAKRVVAELQKPRSLDQMVEDYEHEVGAGDD